MRSVEDVTAVARIRAVAIDRFGVDGVAATTVRAVAADAEVSPALVLHHFGSKEGLRRACDEYVLGLVRAGGPVTVEGLAGALEAASPARRYLVRSLLDGSPAAGMLFGEIVTATQEWLAEGEAAGWVRATADAQARAVIYVSWMFAPAVLGAQVAGVLGGDPTETATAVRGARAGLEMLTHGLFADERWLTAFTTLQQAGGPR